MTENTIHATKHKSPITDRLSERSCYDEAPYFDQLLMEWLSFCISQIYLRIKNIPVFQYRAPLNIECKINNSNTNIASRHKDFTRIHNFNNAKLKSVSISKNKIPISETIKIYITPQIADNPKFVTESNKNDRSDISDTLIKANLKNPSQSSIETQQINGIDNENISRVKNNPLHWKRKTEASQADEAYGIRRRARNTGTAAEKIRERRDNNPYNRRSIDKDQQNRHSVQRDKMEETNRSYAGIGKKSRDRDTVNTTMVEEKSGKTQIRGRSPYQYRSVERETRSLDNGIKKIGRRDQVEETNVIEITKNPAKKLEITLNVNGQGDRENGEKMVSHRDRRKEKRDKQLEEETTMPLSKNKETRVRSTKTTDSSDDTEMGYSHKVGKFVMDDGKLKEFSNTIKYRLSDMHFVKLGWTAMPIIKPMRKITQYEARLAKPNLNWFKRYNKHKRIRYYDDGSMPFLKFCLDGSGKLFYPNGVVAVKIYKPEKRKYDMYTVFTPGGKDVLGIKRESQILALFDSMGNGLVLDEDGTTRLSYNQIGGIFTDNPAGLPLVWTWNVNPKESISEAVYTEKLADRLRMEFLPLATKSTLSSGNIKTPISPSSLSNKEKKVEVQKPVVQERQEEVGSKSDFSKSFANEDIFHIKIICMKLNEFLSLRIIDRRNIALRFSAKNRSIRFELGTILNFEKQIATYLVEANDWERNMLKYGFQEKLSKKLQYDSSLYDLAKEYRKVKRVAKKRKAMIVKYKPF